MTSTQNTRRIGAAALGIVLTLGAAACGTRAAEDTAAPEATATPTPAVTAEPTATPTPAPAETTVEPTAEPADTDATEPAGDETTDVDVTDGSFPGFIQVSSEEVNVDRIEILAGEEAVAARAEDGEPPVEEGLDIPYLRNRNDRLRTLPVADDVVVAVYDCSQACEHIGWDYADLVAGTPLPYGGDAEIPFIVTLRDGEVVELSQVYLP